VRAPTTRAWSTAIVHWSHFDRGGHYAAMEVPEVLAGDTEAFFS
jgi:hypothetical protein